MRALWGLGTPLQEHDAHARASIYAAKAVVRVWFGRGGVEMSEQGGETRLLVELG